MKPRVSVREMCEDGLSTYEMSLDLYGLATNLFLEHFNFVVIV